MSNRLLIKSAVCSYSQDIYSDAEYDIDGNVVIPRAKAHDRLNIKRGDTVSHKVNADTLEVRINGIARTLPIPASAERYRGRP